MENHFVILAVCGSKILAICTVFFFVFVFVVCCQSNDKACWPISWNIWPMNSIAILSGEGRERKTKLKLISCWWLEIVTSQFYTMVKI